MKKILISLVTVLVILTAFLTRPAFAGDIDNGKQLFTANCTACHAGGKNLVNPAKTLALADLEKYGMNSEDAIITQITNGKGAMPPFGTRLKPSQISDIASYVLTQSQQGW